jgi:hypothetical protein
VSPHLNIIILSLGTLLYRVQLLTEPFMNPQSRWWETSARYNVDLHANIRGRKEDLKVRLLDISETGFFVEHPEKLAVGSIFGVDIYFQKSKIHAVGMVVRNSVRPAGVGFTFLAATRSEKSAVKQLIQALEAAAMGATPLPIIVDDDQDQDQIAAEIVRDKWGYSFQGLLSRTKVAGPRYFRFADSMASSFFRTSLR